MSAKLGKIFKLEMLINPKKLLRRERQLKAVIGMSGKEFKILHDQFDKIYKSEQKEKPRIRGVGGGRQGVTKDTKSKIIIPESNRITGNIGIEYLIFKYSLFSSWIRVT